MSDDDFRLLEMPAELGGATALALAEEAVEVCQRVEAAGVADFADTVGGVDELAGGGAEAPQTRFSSMTSWVWMG